MTSHKITSLSVINDEDLMKLYLSGDPRAFDELYKRHSPKVFSYLLKRTERRQEAEELHQAIFLKFHLARHQYDAKFPVLQWIFVISKTTLVDFFRTKGRRVSEMGGYSEREMENIFRADASEQEQADVGSILDGLTEEQKKVLKWRFLDEVSYEEISKRLNRSQVNVRQLVSRALRQLRKETLPEGSEK